MGMPHNFRVWFTAPKLATEQRLPPESMYAPSSFLYPLSEHWHCYPHRTSVAENLAEGIWNLAFLRKRFGSLITPCGATVRLFAWDVGPKGQFEWVSGIIYPLGLV